MAFTYAYTPPTGMEPLPAPSVGATGHFDHHESLDDKINNLSSHLTTQFGILAGALIAEFDTLEAPALDFEAAIAAVAASAVAAQAAASSAQTTANSALATPYCRAWRTGYQSGLQASTPNVMTYTNTASSDPALVPTNGVFTLNRTGIWLLSADMDAQESTDCIHGFQSDRFATTERSINNLWLANETVGGYKNMSTARWFQSGDTVSYIVQRSTTPTLFRPAMSVAFLGTATLT